MIELELTRALALYSSVLLGMALFIWIYAAVTVHHTQRVLEKQHLWRCTFCGFTYLDEYAREMSQCPRCESFNSWDDPQARFIRTRHPAQEAQVEPEDSGRNTSKRKRHHQRRRGPRKRR